MNMTTTLLDQDPPASGSIVGTGPVLAHDAQRVRLYVWQRPVRFTHWVSAVCIAVLALTGGYIADPFLIPPGGSVMTTMRFIHIVAAFTLLASGLVRTVWLLVGNRFARWNAFIPTTRLQATEAFRQAGFYAFLRKDIPKVIGHNQLAAAAYLALFVLLVAETVTGLSLDGALGAEPARTMFGWVGDVFGLQQVRLVHHLAMWAILAIVLFHVYSCVLIDNIEKNGLLSSMVGGYKFPTREEILEARDGGPELLEDLE
jgi:Ni/Fe-hydrogenase 1 B-type cytochrome subunit